MRIAIATGHYVPEMGYWEVQIARALSAEGHEVKVFSSKKLPPRARDKEVGPYQTGMDKDGNVGLERLPYRFALNQVVIPKGLRKAVENYAPDFLLAIGVGKLFTGPLLLPPSKRSYRLAALFGNNRYNYRNAPLLAAQKRLVQRWLKDRHYEKAVRNCEHLWSYTPETEEILREFVSPKLHGTLREKLQNTTLGFDPERFFFDPEERRKERDRWGLEKDETLFVTATRLIPSKALDELIRSFERLFEEAPKAHYLLIGSTGNAYGKKLQGMMESSPYKDRFHFLPFQPEEDLRKAFTAADIGIWTAPAITVQKAMGTGLPVILPDSPSLKQLLQEGVSGTYYQEGEQLPTLKRAFETFGPDDKRRETLASKNQERLSDRVIAREIVERSMEGC